MQHNARIVRKSAIAEPVRGSIVELFSGIQGEGPHVGRRQIFLRLAGCNLACDYCDQPEARSAPEHALIEETPGRRDFRPVENPLTTDAVADMIRRLDRPRGLHTALALTGGEPLIQAPFLVELLPLLRGTGLRALLETNGTRPAELAALLPYLDIVSMDVKLRSATGRPMPRARHAEFLRLAAQSGAEVYVKAVACAKTTRGEIAQTARLVAEAGADIPLVIQPATPRAGVALRPPTPEQVLDFQECASRFLKDVRVIPQTHVMLGQR